MSNFGAFVNRSMFELPSRASGVTMAVAAILLYAGVGLAAPLSLGLPLVYLVGANVVGAACAVVLCVGWIDARLNASDRPDLPDSTLHLGLIDAPTLAWSPAELYRREGWVVKGVARDDELGGDIDLVLIKAGQRRSVTFRQWAVEYDRSSAPPEPGGTADERDVASSPDRGARPVARTGDR